MDDDKLELKPEDLLENDSINVDINADVNADINVEKSEVKINYEKEDYISAAVIVENGTVPINLLQFYHSYSYDCRKYFNLCVADSSTLIFSSGVLIAFFDIDSGELKFQRCSTGLGVGHIAKNPQRPHIAVGENGKYPPIIIYDWPSMEIVTVLSNGTRMFYSHLAYSPDGRLLVSQGGQPDYLITIWDWRRSKILLRCKSHEQDIYNAIFSPTVPGHLVTSGAGHVKFWRISRTFTGLKLEGQLAKFGKTEISDVIGLYSMPDEKVISGCEWGNILVWEEGIIKLEVRRKNNKPCHTNMITQFEYIDGDLMSVGMDGWIRTWSYESIDQADPPEDHPFIEIEPIHEFNVSTEGGSDVDFDEDTLPSSMLMAIGKKYPENPGDRYWYAQDGYGSLWLINLSTFDEVQTGDTPGEAANRQLLKCHAGSVMDMAACTWGQFVATIGADGFLHIYKFLEKKLIVARKFYDSGSALVWLPCSLDSTGSTIICGFRSGVVRVVRVSVSSMLSGTDDYNSPHLTKLIQVVKPHSDEVTVVTVDSPRRLLITASRDSTIFIFSIGSRSNCPNLTPIGFIKMPSGVMCTTWRPEASSVMLVGCRDGHFGELQLPQDFESHRRSFVTYQLDGCQSKFFKFSSVKSAYLREIAREEINQMIIKRQEETRVKMEEYREQNPGIEIDEDIFMMDTEELPPLPELYIPERSNPILTVNYTNDGGIWLSVGGYDAGYIYEYPSTDVEGDEGSEAIVNTEPRKITPIKNAEDLELQSFLTYKNKFAFFGLQHGEIRVCRLNPSDYTNFSDCLILPMHDYSTGDVRKILLSHDETFVFSCGHDGNIFSFAINDDEPSKKIEFEKFSGPLDLPEVDVEDIEDISHPTLEQVIVTGESSRIMALTTQNRDNTYALLRQLTKEYQTIVERCKGLVKSQQINLSDLTLDQRLVDDLNNQLQSEMNVIHEKMSFQVEKNKLILHKLIEHFITPITFLPFAVSRVSDPKLLVHSINQKALEKDFHATYAKVLQQISEYEDRERIMECNLDKIVDDDEEETEVSEDKVDTKMDATASFLKDQRLSAIQDKLTVEVNQMLRKYRAKRSQIEKRMQEWAVMYANKPDPNSDHPEDIEQIEMARKTIGDYKLKISKDYSINHNKGSATLRQYKQLLDCKRKCYYLREDFNQKLKAVRSKKMAIQNEAMNLVEKKLKAIYAEIPEKYVKHLDEIPEIDEAIEYPEHNLEMEKYIPMAERVKELRKLKQSIIDETMQKASDDEYKTLLLDETLVEDYSDMLPTSLNIVDKKKIKDIEIAVSESTLSALNEADRTVSPWEREMKAVRASKKINEQDCIIKHIESSYKSIDDELNELETDRLNIYTDTVYSELYQLTLHQELMILRNFEKMENSLTEKLNKNVTERALALHKLQSTMKSIDRKNREIKNLQIKVKELTTQFTSAVHDNKYFKFLMKIFKKKMAPRKLQEEGGSLASSSQSSDSLDESTVDDGSDATGDIHRGGQIYLDENICPPDCSRELYDFAFSMRLQRHNCENSIREEQKAVESLVREVDLDSRKIKQIENTLKDCQETLLEFMYNKQCKLNDIDMTLVLKFHQFRHFTDDDNLSKIRDCVVFDKTKLSRLYTRVGELQQETRDQKIKHQKNRTHLHRMKIDCKYMQSQIKVLKSEIKQAMFRKFGCEVSLCSLYEAVLRKMMYDIKANMTDSRQYEKQLRDLKKKYNEQVLILESLIKDNTEKLSFLTVLNEELMKLRKITKRRPDSPETIMKTELEWREDLLKLEAMLANQKQQKEFFKNDVRTLKLKVRTLPPVSARGKFIKSFNKILTKSEEAPPIPSAREEKDEEKAPHTAPTAETDKTKNDSAFEIVRNLLSKIVQIHIESEEAESIVDQFFHEIFDKYSNFPTDFIDNFMEICEKIEKRIEEISGNVGIADNIREIILEYANEIISQLEIESRGIGVGSIEISWDVKPKIDEFLDSMEIKKDMITEVYLMKFLKMENGLELATDYILTKLPKKPDTETIVALREHATRTLREIQKHIYGESEPDTTLHSSHSAQS